MAGRFIAISLVLVLTALAFPATAQNSRIDVSIPYEFIVANRKLAAGSYVITRPVPTNPRVFSFRGEAKNQKASATTHTRTTEEAAKDTELFFAKYKEATYLRSIRLRGSTDAYELPVSKAERALAKSGEPEMISIKVESK